MAKLPDYKGSVDLISGIRPKNGGDFPLVEAHDILVGNNDKRLDEALGDIESGLDSIIAIQEALIGGATK